MIALLLTLPLVAPQQPDRQPGPSAPVRPLNVTMRADLERPSDAIHYDRPYGEDLWVRAPGYKARFGSETSEFIPFLGPDAPTNFPVDLSLQSATAGGQALVLTSETLPTRSGHVVSIDRGALVEQYRIGLEGIEQTFVFDEPLHGELVLRVGARADTPAIQTGSRFEFRAQSGGVRVSEAVAVDAGGRRLPLSSTWTDGVFEYRVPAAFVEQADYPLVVDPLFTPFLIDDFSAPLTKPRVAFDPTTATWLVVYNEQFSGSDKDVFSRRVDLSGNILFEGYVDSTSDNWTEVDVAASSDTFLVTALRQDAAFTVVSRLIDPAVGSYTAVQALSTSGTYVYRPRVGGDILDRYLVVWSRGTGQFDANVRARMVSDTGSPSGSIVNLTAPGGYDIEPAISRINHETDAIGAAWCVAFRRAASGSNIWATEVLWDGSIVRPPYTITAGLLEYREPRVSSPLDMSGPNTYCIAYTVQFPGDTDIAAAVVRGGAVVAQENLSLNGLDGSYHDDETALAIDSNGTRFSMTWMDQDYTAGRVATLAFVAGEVCVAETRDFAPNNVPTGIAAIRSAGNPEMAGGENYLCVAEDRTIVGNENIWGAQLNDYANCLGLSFCFSNPNSSGYTAELYGLGTGIAGDPLTLFARNLPLNQTAMFIVSRSTSSIPLFQGQLCLGGPIGRYATLVQNSGSTGEVSIIANTNAIPIFPTMPAQPGETLYFQCWYRDVNPGGTANLTTGWQVGFQ